MTTFTIFLEKTQEFRRFKLVIDGFEDFKNYIAKAYGITGELCFSYKYYGKLCKVTNNDEFNAIGEIPLIISESSQIDMKEQESRVKSTSIHHLLCPSCENLCNECICDQRKRIKSYKYIQ